MKALFDRQGDFEHNKWIDKALNQFWTGFIIYTTSYTLMISGSVPAYISYLQLLGILLFVPPTFNLIRFKLENSYLRTLYILYFVWQFFIVVRGFTFNKDYLFNTLIDATGGIFLYCVPIILLFPSFVFRLKKTKKVITILSFIYVFFILVFLKVLLANDNERSQYVLEYFAKNLAIPCGFLLITFLYYHNKNKKWAFIQKGWILLVMFLTFLLAIIRARRGLIFMSANIFLFSYIVDQYTPAGNKLFPKFLPLVLIFGFLLFAANDFTFLDSDYFSLVNERLNEDTRSEAEDYFYLDMNKTDWIIGRGIDGSYYCPTGATEDGFRNVIETDYLQIVLKGGMVSLFLLLLIAVPAVFLGLFYSKNILTKAAAIWILLWLLALYPQTVTVFSLNYMLVWISIGICFSKTIRNQPENLIQQYLMGNIK